MYVAFFDRLSKTVQYTNLQDIENPPQLTTLAVGLGNTQYDMCIAMATRDWEKTNKKPNFRHSIV